MKVEATLISEIKNLDGERKALVYDNYRKLIYATRTIGGMRKSVDGGTDVLDRRIGRQGQSQNQGLNLKGMEALRDAVGDVARMAEELSGNSNDSGTAEVERSKRAKAERDKRETVRWVLGGPERLRGMVEEEKMDQAQAEWKVIRALLGKWEGVKGVQETRKACSDAMQAGTEEQNGTG